MRVALVIASLAILTSSSIYWWLQRTAGCPLAIVSAREPQFVFPEEARTEILEVRLPVAVTNNTRSKLLVCVGVTPATRLLDGTPNPFRIWRPYGTDLELQPKAGALCTVRYMKGEPPCVLGADYHIVESPLKAKVRLLLHTCGLRWIGTNDIWHTLQVARIEQH